jgi:SynChlorMet cassette radical SAM/SPASM protein ScmF
MKRKKLPDYFLNQLYFYLTEGCNLRCRHCWIQPKYQTKDIKYPALDFKLFKKIIKEAKHLGLSGIKLTGGEPLLHPDIDEILDFIRAEALRLTVETNGILCTPDLSKKLASCTSPFVSVSLDGADAETNEWVRGVPGCFDEAIKGIKNLVNTGFNPQIILTLMRRNKHQMEAIVRLAESLGVGSVKINILQPTARGEKMHEAGEALSIDELVELGQWVEESLVNSPHVGVFYSHPLAFRPMHRMFGSKGDGCSVCGILGILGVLADGSYALCGIGETVPELVFGHAAKDKLEAVWNNNPVLMEIREGLPERLGGICVDCLMKDLCLGSCIAQNYYTTKDIWAPHWYCQQAHDRGIFPASRTSSHK